MRFDCGLTAEAKHAAKEGWHSWFAWHPVRMGSRECAWFETIERKGEYKWFADMCGGVFGSWVYEYRQPVSESSATNVTKVGD